MAHYPHITDEQAALIRSARVFFVASAAPDLAAGPEGQGPVNLSPKGGVPLHIIDRNRVAYLDYTGSGNQTARHAQQGGPVTVMVMSMEAENAAIVRLFGHATVAPVDESPLADVVASRPADKIGSPVRQVVDIRVESTQTSCGYGVPVFEYIGERDRDNRGRKYKAPKSQQPGARP